MAISSISNVKLNNEILKIIFVPSICMIYFAVIYLVLNSFYRFFFFLENITFTLTHVLAVLKVW